MVHGELGHGPLEIATAHGICSCGMMALKNAYLQVRSARSATRSASPASSRHAGSELCYDEMRAISEDGSLPMETAFLRYMLSDGAGAAVIESARGIGDQPSHRPGSADVVCEHEACMYFGSNDNACSKTWGDYPTAAAAAADGALAPRQKLSLLPHLVRVGIDEYQRLCAMGKLDPNTVTWFPAHYSSERMKTLMFGELSRRNVAMGRPEMWYSNLTRVGNIGSAAIFVILDEMMSRLRSRTVTRCCAWCRNPAGSWSRSASHCGVGGFGVGAAMTRRPRFPASLFHGRVPRRPDSCARSPRH
jgi:3-oxoacyl-[acyl-carrier-protein] synthase-3